MNSLAVKSNKDKLMKQVLMGKIAPPVMFVEGGLMGAYVTTWDGKPKIGIGVGGIKYNVKVGDPCFGWPETEYLSPGVSFMGHEDTSEGNSYNMKGTAQAFVKYTAVGTKVIMVSGEGKGVEGVVTGKGGTGTSGKHVFVYFKKGDLEKLNIGDKAKFLQDGVGLEIEGFKGRVFNLSPSFLDSLGLRMSGDTLEVPVAKEIPAVCMGMGVGGSSAESGNWCIQSNPPHLVEKYGYGDLKIGDIVACRDVLMDYGKGYYRGAVTIGVVTCGASDVAGHGPGVMALASSKKGNIKPVLTPDANIAKYLELEGV
jgi:hypothetical protein